MDIRPSRKADLAALKLVLDETVLFPSDMLPAMMGEHLFGGANSDIWLTCHVEEVAVGFCYAVPEMLAEGTWNMAAIAVLPGQQGGGCGAALTGHLEAVLQARGQRILIAETSSTASFAGARAFYRKTGYNEEARIRDFWVPGDDKVVFWKSLDEKAGQA